MENKSEVSLKEINEYISKQNIKFATKTPQNTIISILTRLKYVEHIGYGKYRLRKLATTNFVGINASNIAAIKNNKRGNVNLIPIRVLIEKFMESKGEVSIKEIIEYLNKQKILFITKTPNTKIYYILVQMDNVERVRWGKYSLKK